MRKQDRMLSRGERAALNLERARELRAGGATYREIRRDLGLTPAQLGYLRRTLKREKGASTRLRNADAQATPRDLPVGRSALPAGLRRCLQAAGYTTLGALADRIDDRNAPSLATLPGIGPYRLRLVTRLLERFELLAGSDDLQAAVEQIFPELRD